MFSGLFSVIFFLLISSNNAHTPGTVTVDTFTFDKILQKFDIVLAKFDDKTPSGDKYDQFKKFAEIAGNSKKLLVVEIPISDYGDQENEDLARKYNIKKEDYPVYKLFLKDKSKPMDYTGDKTENDLKRFVSERTHVWFGLAGTLEELDYLARDFFDASSNKDQKGQITLLKKAREEVRKLNDKKEQKSGESYLKIMETIAKQGIEFLQREGRRLENLLKEKITNEKKIELQHRANIIHSFKSAKESIMYKLNDAKNDIFNTAQQIKQTVTGDKDL